LDISNGLIQYIDLKERYFIELKNIDLALQNIGFDDEITVDLALSLLDNEQNINLKGNLGPVGQQLNIDNLPLKLDLIISSLDLKKIKKTIPQLKDLLPPEIEIIDRLSLNTKLVGNLSKLRLSDIDLKCSLFGSDSTNLKVNGSVGPVGSNVAFEDIFFKLDLDLGPVNSENLLSLNPLESIILPDLKLEGPLSFSGNIEGNLSNLSVKNGILDASGSNIVFDKSFNKPKGINLTLKINANFKNDNLELKDTNLKLSSLQLDVAGKYNFESSRADLNLKSNKANLETLSKIIPDIKAYNITGFIETSFFVSLFSTFPVLPKVEKLKFPFLSLIILITGFFKIIFLT